MDGDPWAEYARLQLVLSRTTDANKAAGIEAALSDLLEKIATGEPCSPRQTKTLVVNRIGRERRRRAIVHAGRKELSPEVARDGPAESSLILRDCSEVCGERDFTLLINLAMGYSYPDLSAVAGVNHNTLKIWVHRARRKILHLAA